MIISVKNKTFCNNLNVLVLYVCSYCIKQIHLHDICTHTSILTILLYNLIIDGLFLSVKRRTSNQYTLHILHLSNFYWKKLSFTVI